MFQIQPYTPQQNTTQLKFGRFRDYLPSGRTTFRALYRTAIMGWIFHNGMPLTSKYVVDNSSGLVMNWIGDNAVGREVDKLRGAVDAGVPKVCSSTTSAVSEWWKTHHWYGKKIEPGKKTK